MADTELFVICNNCGEEVSPYVTECPYCGHRLRKRAPDLKKARKQEEREERKASKRRERLKRQYEGGEPERGAYLGRVGNVHVATTALILISVIVSLIARIDTWTVQNFVFSGDLAGHPWQAFTSPLVQGGFTYGFICLAGVAIFGSGIEARFGSLALVLVWIVCGAFGVLVEEMLAPIPFTNGAYGIAVGMMAAWLIVVVTREDLRDYDGIALGAAGAVLLALPIATNEASVWTLVGGLLGGALCGGALTQRRARAV